MQRTRASSTQGLGVLTESLCFWVEHVWNELNAKQLKNVENTFENTTVSTFLHSKQHFDHTSAQKCCMSLDTRCATQISRKTIRHNLTEVMFQNEILPGKSQKSGKSILAAYKQTRKRWQTLFVKVFLLPASLYSQLQLQSFQV